MDHHHVTKHERTRVEPPPNAVDIEAPHKGEEQPEGEAQHPEATQVEEGHSLLPPHPPEDARRDALQPVEALVERHDGAEVGDDLDDLGGVVVFFGVLGPLAWAPFFVRLYGMMGGNKRKGVPWDPTRRSSPARFLTPR